MNQLSKTPSKLTIKQFINELPQHYKQYTQSQYYEKYTYLEGKLSEKARTIGYLEQDDLSEIAEWGGNQRGIKQRMIANNTKEDVIRATKNAIQQINHPAEALRELLIGIDHWGLSYASKTLRFIYPENFSALDQKLRQRIDFAILPKIYDGHIDSMIKGYLVFLELCRDIQSDVNIPGPRSGKWFIADIEMSLFQFVWNDGYLVKE